MAGRLEAQLVELHGLREAPDDAALRKRLRWFLKRGSSPAAARAAELIAARRLEGLEIELAAMYRRFLRNGVRTDPGCPARRAALEALDQLDVEDTALFAEAARLVQWEPVWGGRIDTAGPVRAQAALALGRVWSPRTSLLLGELLADDLPVVRRAAIEAIAHRGDADLAALLVLRYRLGDDDPVARGECLSALLRLAPAHAVAMLDPLLRSTDADDADEQALAMMALAESRQPRAFVALRDWLERAVLGTWRERLLDALAAHRSEEAREFLLEFIAEEASTHEARRAVTALAAQLFMPAAQAQLVAAAEAHSAELGALARELVG